MKTVLLIIFIACGFSGHAQIQDSIHIRDNWYKRDTAILKQSMKDSLYPDQEMKIIKDKQKTNEQSIRIIAGDGEIQNIPSEEKRNYEIEILGSRYKKSRNYRNRKYHYFHGHLCGANFGFINFTDTDYSMYSPEDDGFMDLDYTNSFVMQFNICEQSINFVPRNNFGMVIGLGLEYQRFRFDKKNISIIKNDEGQVLPRMLDPEWNIKKNSFKILYLSIPVMLELQMPARNYKRFFIAAGAMGGIRLLSRTKIIYRNADGDKKRDRNTNDYSLMPVKADLIARVGYDCWNVWASYTVTDIFRNHKGPELHPYAIGLGFTFN